MPFAIRTKYSPVDRMKFDLATELYVSPEQTSQDCRHVAKESGASWRPPSVRLCMVSPNLLFGHDHSSSMQDERFEDGSEHLDRAFDDNLDTVARIDDPDLAWSEPEDEEIGGDLDSEDEREQATKDGGADDEDWELAERGAVLERGVLCTSTTEVGITT